MLGTKVGDRVLITGKHTGERWMDWIFLLAIVTFGLFLAFLAWNRASLKQHQAGDTAGIGGLADPMSGTTTGMRDPEEMRAALNAMRGRRAPAAQRAD